MGKRTQEDCRVALGGLDRPTANRVYRLLEPWACQLAGSDLDGPFLIAEIMFGPTDDELYSYMVGGDYERMREFVEAPGSYRRVLMKQAYTLRCDIPPFHPSQCGNGQHVGGL